MSDFWNGAFSVTWTPPSGAAVVLGTTERGVRVNFGTPSSVQVREDRWGDTIVEEFYLGVVDNPRVTIESLNFKVGAEYALRSALAMIGVAGATMPADIDTANGIGTVRQTTIGAPIVETVLATGGSLVLQAVRGKLISTTGFKITLPKALPMEPVDTLLTLRGPIRVPFGFRVWPTYVDDVGWQYYTFTKQT